MLHQLGIETRMRFDVQELRGILVDNKLRHENVFNDAIAGYLMQARAKLKEGLQQLDDDLGRLERGEHFQIKSLRFGLEMPRHNLAAYDVVLGMLKATTDQEIELGPDEYRQLVQDEWDWSRIFYLANAMYCDSAAEIATSHGWK